MVRVSAQVWRVKECQSGCRRFPACECQTDVVPNQKATVYEPANSCRTALDRGVLRQERITETVNVHARPTDLVGLRYLWKVSAIRPC